MTRKPQIVDHRTKREGAIEEEKNKTSPSGLRPPWAWGGENWEKRGTEKKGGGEGRIPPKSIKECSPSLEGSAGSKIDRRGGEKNLGKDGLLRVGSQME